MANSKKKCRHCKTYERVETGIEIGTSFYCCEECKVEFALSSGKNAYKKIVATVEKKQRTYTRKRKKEMLTRSDWIKKVKKACHKYIRLRDNGKKCVTCDKMLMITGRPGGDYDAGHYRSVGSAKHMEFHTLNIHGQCKKCNNPTWGGHDKDVYTKELIKRIGPGLVDKINSDQRDRKYTIQDLERLEQLFKDKVKALEKRK